jgi:MYXO-CTERM domain-containing protein
MRATLSIIAATLTTWGGLAHAQCELVQGEDEILGTGTSVRMAVDPVTEEPVVLYDRGDAIVYRHFYGPDWGREVTVDTGGLAPVVNADGVFQQAMDLVLDRYGRVRLVLADEAGVHHTRYTSGWSGPENLVPWSLGDPELGGVHVGFERDPSDRVHLVAWTSAYDGGSRRTFHAVDHGAGFGAAEHVDSGWTTHAAAATDGTLHAVSFAAFTDPDGPLHEYQAYHWTWSPEQGWDGEQATITDEPNPVEGNGAGPVGFWPAVAVSDEGVPFVPYPMHETDDATVGRMHVVERSSGAWSEPHDLFDCNGHGGKPQVAIDHRDTVLVVGLVYDKHFAADFGHGFEQVGRWNDSSSHWQFHDLVETRGLFWHVHVPVYWSNGERGDVTVTTFTKEGSCPGIEGTDLDDDGADDSHDLCPGFPDPAQRDTDGDGIGDGCDTDDDDDGVEDAEDVCPRLYDPDQLDSDGDGLGDACANQVDADLDGFLAPWECDDSDPTAYPGNDEDCGDGVDNDCDGAVDGDDPDCPAGDDDDVQTGDDDDDGGWESGCSCRQDADHRPPVPVLAALGAAGLFRRRRR